jgi:hypothetical protein
MGNDTKREVSILVVNTFLRRTFFVLPSPIQRAVRFALPKRNKAEAKPKQSFMADIDMMADAVFGPLWKE